MINNFLKCCIVNNFSSVKFVIFCRNLYSNRKIINFIIIAKW